MITRNNGYHGCRGRRLPLSGSHTSAAAKDILRATLFCVVGPSGRPLICAAYEVQTGWELRLSYGDDVMRTELFHGVDRDERVAETADAWRLRLLQKGFLDVRL